jgi:hypothetical protein
MAALQTLAVPKVVLSARLRLALHPHAASTSVIALDRRQKTRCAQAPRVFSLWKNWSER